MGDVRGEPRTRTTFAARGRSPDRPPRGRRGTSARPRPPSPAGRTDRAARRSRRTGACGAAMPGRRRRRARPARWPRPRSPRQVRVAGPGIDPERGLGVPARSILAATLCRLGGYVGDEPLVNALWATRVLDGLSQRRGQDLLLGLLVERLQRGPVLAVDLGLDLPRRYIDQGGRGLVAVARPVPGEERLAIPGQAKPPRRDGRTRK